MLYLLDTNAMSDLMRGSQLRQWLSTLPTDAQVVTCPIVRGEILFGISRLPEGRRRADLEERARFYFEVIPTQPLTPGVAEHYAAIKGRLERSGSLIDENDLWIASTACHLGATLVTRDRDFSRIAGLSVLGPT